MKLIVLISALLLLSACNRPSGHMSELEARIDSLQAELGRTYRPGLGEFMEAIQVHHAKLWFAGKAGNWDLANFEVHEIGEALGDIRAYCTNRPEVKDLGMLSTPLDSLSLAITRKDTGAFAHGFALLTATCNSCHQATGHGFNVITIPTAPPFSNQAFGVALGY